jgi:hypothetical protein
MLTFGRAWDAFVTTTLRLQAASTVFANACLLPLSSASHTTEAMQLFFSICDTIECKANIRYLTLDANRHRFRSYTDDNHFLRRANGLLITYNPLKDTSCAELKTFVTNALRRGGKVLAPNNSSLDATFVVAIDEPEEANADAPDTNVNQLDPELEAKRKKLHEEMVEPWKEHFLMGDAAFTKMNMGDDQALQELFRKWIRENLIALVESKMGT